MRTTNCGKRIVAALSRRPTGLAWCLVGLLLAPGAPLRCLLLLAQPLAVLGRLLLLSLSRRPVGRPSGRLLAPGAPLRCPLLLARRRGLSSFFSQRFFLCDMMLLAGRAEALKLVSGLSGRAGVGERPSGVTLIPLILIYRFPGHLSAHSFPCTQRPLPV